MQPMVNPFRSAENLLHANIGQSGNSPATSGTRPVRIRSGMAAKSIMQSARETAARFGETVQQNISGQKPSAQKGRTQIPEWNTEEMLETTLDKDGNAVPDYSFTDGEKMMKGTKGPDEADAYVAANADFK
ncbi:hypothetical protein BDV59DRAFT_203701 [Aspergillus ambiguus]|uniref:uncharacterized protein n=1 Tax=Aspergillus ambiguus TaxID=176160 RepID=UPI003CCE0D91